MTAAELYKADPGFRALITIWVKKRRCPLVLVDYLLDREMYAQAECARWAATAPDRKVLTPLRFYGERDGRCGPYPGCFGRDDWQWEPGSVFGAFGVPAGATRPGFESLSYKTPRKAVLGLMDAWLLTEALA